MKKNLLKSIFFSSEQSNKGSVTVYKKTSYQSPKEILKNEQRKIDNEIKELIKGLIEVQIVKIKSIITKDKNWFNLIQKKYYQISINQSINWHIKSLKEAIIKRNQIQQRYRRINSNLILFYLKEILRIIKIILIIITFISIVAITVSSIPLLLLLIFIYIIINMNSIYK